MKFIRPLLAATAMGVCSLLTLAGAATAEQFSAKEYPNDIGVRNLSPVPAPGVHPRIFFSPEDLPALREAATRSEARQIYYTQLKKIVAEKLDAPNTPEGKVMALLAQGRMPSAAQFAAAEKLSYLLLLAGIDALIQNDPARGEKLAAALSAWGSYQLKHWERKPDPVGLHNRFDSELCLAYDFIAPWMNETQRAPVRQFIAKMMNGIHIFTWDMPPRWRMWNWAGLHVYQGYGSLAIEGEPGYTPQLWDEACRVARDFVTYNVHPSGALTEDLTYFTLGFEGSGLLMVAMAKRGEQDVWATSNLPNLKYHLLNQLYPWGGEFQSHADGVGSGFYTSFAIWKYMYPKDPMFDFTWRNRVGEHYDNAGPGNDASMRVWVVTLFGTEHFPATAKAADFQQPLTYFCPDRGYLVARSSWDKDAVKLDFEAKQDYPIVGHNHADANNFTLDALGREWAADPGYHQAAGHQHNEVMIDGVAESPWPAPGGRWVDLVNTPEAVIGVSDGKHAYDYHWSDTGYSPDNNPPSDKEKWEKETEPTVMAFYEGQENRKRTGIFDHYSPFLLRSSWNPVQRAFRTASLVRGVHPYVFIVDDIQKDDAVHLYEWIQQLPDDLEVLRSGGDWVVLGANKDAAVRKGKNAEPVPDKARLLVRLVDVEKAGQADAMAIRLESFSSSPGKAYEAGSLRKRLTIPARAVAPRYKVLLYPFYEGAELPRMIWNEEHTQCRLLWHDQDDCYTFGTGAGGRTVYRLERDNKPLATLEAPPPAPVLRSDARVFTESCSVEFVNPGPGQEIRYTLDGSAPGPDSTFYAGPLTLDKSATLKAATFARDWQFGKNRSSAVLEAAFNRQAPLPALAQPRLKPGLRVALYNGFWNTLPDFAREKPCCQQSVDHFILPPETPAKAFGVRFTGCLQAPVTGAYTFGLKCDDAGKLWIDGRLVVDNDGAHVVQTRTGQIALAPGWHQITVENCDNALPLGKGHGDGSWALEVLWAPPQVGALSEVPSTVLAQEAAGAVKLSPAPSIAAERGLKGEPGLGYSAYDRSAQAGTPEFFNLKRAQSLETGTALAVETPDSSVKLLHVYRGFLKVPHAGVYQFALAANAIGELTLGNIVVSRVGLAADNVSAAVQLEAGPVPVMVKLARGSGLVQWKGPGMDWQNIRPQDWLRRASPANQSAQRNPNAGLLGIWSATQFKNHTLPNAVKGGAPDFVFPEGTSVVTDPQRGKVLTLEECPRLVLDKLNLLKNDLTFSFWLKPAGRGSLVRYGWAHTGFFVELNGGLRAGGGGNWNVASISGNAVDSKQWHHVAITIGGKPVRGITLYVDGAQKTFGEVNTSCLVPNLEFLEGYSGLLSEIQMFNRVLAPEEIAVLKSQSNCQPVPSSKP